MKHSIFLAFCIFKFVGQIILILNSCSQNFQKFFAVVLPNANEISFIRNITRLCELLGETKYIVLFAFRVVILFNVPHHKESGLLHSINVKCSIFKKLCIWQNIQLTTNSLLLLWGEIYLAWPFPANILSQDILLKN